MRLYAASASAVVQRTLDAIILASGHTIAGANDAELILVDTIHPLLSLKETTQPCWCLGDSPHVDQPALPLPIKPQHLQRLLATKLAPQSLPLGAGWAVDLLARQLVHATIPAVVLTEKECALLKVLLQAQSAALSRDVLLAEVWGITHTIDTHTLETHIYRLRHKLEGLTPPPCDILTEDGAYRLVEIAARSSS